MTAPTSVAGRAGRGLAALALVGTSLGAGAVVAAPAAAPALAASTCTAPDVALVVDFTHWPGGFQGNGSAGNRVSACVPFTSGMKGIDLFTKGGFTTAGTQHDGPAFLCRINGLPATTGNPAPRTSEPCTLTPPASAYWSYWYAKPGATTWTYSSYGAYSNTVTAGRVEAWTYGATDIGGTTGQPSFSPQSVMPATAAAAPAPATPSRGGGAPATGGPGAGAATGSTGGGAGSRSSSGAATSGATTPAATTPGSTTTPTAAATAGTPGASTSAGGTADGSAGASDPRTVDIKDIAQPAGVSSSGTPWATVATVAALAVAALVGGGLAWRRKRVSS